MGELECQIKEAGLDSMAVENLSGPLSREAHRDESCTLWTSSVQSEDL